MKIQFVSFLQNLIIFAFSNFWETSQSNTHKLLQGLNRLHFLKNRNSKWSWNEWIKKILFLFQVEFQFISNISIKTIHVISWTSAMLYHWWIQNKKNSVDNKDSNNIWKSYQRSRARFAMSSASSLIIP